ncbi:hypothetical protein ABZX30_32400 [Streptomyces sp. NPDC004542]|uniref:hypothetical protein n=1 Tax=Streptomyces sp. NPDC004542 TaxID=3154281 RepID=UPI0033B618A2
MGGSPNAAAPGPTDAVTLVPLDRPTRGGGTTAGRDGGTPRPSGTATEHHPGRSASGRGTGSVLPGTAEAPGSGRTASKPPSPTPEPPSPTPAPGSGTTAPGAAALTWGEPTRTATDKRWCEDVTLGFHNSGGTAVRSGTVTFGTHIVDALGIDWATVGSAEDLPTPIGAGARQDHTWRVCVKTWRVPLGMHVETRDVDVEWE